METLINNENLKTDKVTVLLHIHNGNLVWQILRKRKNESDSSLISPVLSKDTADYFTKLELIKKKCTIINYAA